VRVFADGDFVFSHTDYDFFGPKVGFDIFRFEAGKIVEHWDNLQDKPATANPSGRTMLDGPTEATELDRTEANKALVRAFVDDVLVNGRMAALPRYFDGDSYQQHNPQVADGLSGLGAALEAFARGGLTLKYDRIHHVLGEGNFVLVASEGTFGGRATSFYDLFRVADGKIAEHWDTIEAIPPRAQWKNANGKIPLLELDDGRCLAESNAILCYLADGTPLPDCARRAIRRHLDWARPLPPLRTATGARFVIDFLTAPVDALQPPVSRLALQLYEDRADLQTAFPDMLATRREAYL
ncbi:MAG TPA: nuclear transport factor 2 family protein, partial [Kofleriaceae bacterium]|nr:nuclear transport factor 2 family protein [Kofleriaceae bacterium]